jgi:hypothetical protein
MFVIGDEVRVIAGRSPRHGWGEVKPEDIGIIREVRVDSYWVDFPRHPYWRAGLNDLELVNREPDWEI